LSSSPNWLKRAFRSKYLTLPFGIYVNLRTISEGKPYFGQLGEDQILERWLPESSGFYLDIGAGYPVRGSNTYLFYKRGWRGIAVEPIRSSTIMFKLFRPADRVINRLVGSSTGYSYFYHFEPYEYSTTNPEIATQMLKRSDTKLLSKKKYRQIKLSDLELELSPFDATLISIDAEGADLEILKGFPWAKGKARVICVEEWADRINPSENVTDFLVAQGYTLTESLSPSLIFVADEYLQYVGAK